MPATVQRNSRSYDNTTNLKLSESKASKKRIAVKRDVEKRGELSVSNFPFLGPEDIKAVKCDVDHIYLAGPPKSQENMPANILPVTVPMVQKYSLYMNFNKIRKGEVLEGSRTLRRLPCS